jgi:signal transduction histidine kinase/CheY-like chemotaxis protein
MARTEPIQVLLIEDNPGDARLVRLMLAEGVSPDYDTTHVTHLGEAIKRIHAAPPEVILLDISLPDAQGFQTFARVCEEAPAIPIVLLTSHDDQYLAIEVVRQGAQDYLIKGQFDAYLLIHAIRYAIERKRFDSRIQNLLQRQIAINRLADALGRAADLGEVYHTISVYLSRLMDVEIFLVSSYEDKNQLIRAEFLYTRGGGVEDPSQLPPIPLDPSGNSPQSQVIRTGKPLHIPDWKAVLREANAVYTIKDDGEIVRAMPERGDGSEINSVILAPMQAEEETVGVMQVQSSVVKAYSQEDVELFVALTNVASLAVRNVGLVDDLRRSNADLSEERGSLARRVEERTAELRALNAELAQAARLKDEFMANMSHELRTPLNAVLGLGQALQEQVYGPINVQQMRALKNIEQSADHLLAVINDILDISKIEAGKIVLELMPVDVEAVCESALQMVITQAAKRGIQLETVYDPSVLTIFGDARRLKQVLVNLLSNAVKFTPDGGRVGLEVVGQVAENAVLFIVWDTGIGIPPDTIKLLFRPFVQLDSSLSRRYEGAGLGLALVARLAELHGGTVSVESPAFEGRGSRFTVRLPWRRCSVDEVADELEGATEPPPYQDPMPLVGQILLVEDNEGAIEAMIPYLERLGYSMAVARDGREAVERAKALRPDAIIMDIMLPVQDGLETIRQIRADSALAEIPIIVVTGLVSPADEQRCRAAGADDYLVKPVHFRTLAGMIAARLARSRLEKS